MFGWRASTSFAKKNVITLSIASARWHTQVPNVLMSSAHSTCNFIRVLYFFGYIPECPDIIHVSAWIKTFWEKLSRSSEYTRIIKMYARDKFTNFVYEKFTKCMHEFVLPYFRAIIHEQTYFCMSKNITHDSNINICYIHLI